MTNHLSKIGISALLTFVLWHATDFIILVVTDLSSDSWLNMGRVWPYGHVHLSEEYLEGLFHPEKELLFLLAAFLRNTVAFSVGTALLVKHKLGKTEMTIYILTASIPLSIFLIRSSVTPMYPAYIVEFTFALIGVWIGRTLPSNIAFSGRALVRSGNSARR